MRNIIGIAIVLVSLNAFAKNKKFCGKREGTAGNAILVDKKNVEVITLAVQGEGDGLLSQADALIATDKKGNSGTQNGQNYCVVAELNDSGEPIKIVKAYLQK